MAPAHPIPYHPSMKIHLVDGTFELFRAYFGSPRALSPSGLEVGAVRGLMRSIYALCREDDVTHVAVAFDHVIESFRNELFAGYKTGEGMEPELYAQFVPAEAAVAALGVVVWPMIEFETDDALAAAAARFGQEPGVEQVVICSPDKDLCQCVRGDRIVTFDRMRRRMLNEQGVVEKFGVPPTSIPDYLALVGDAADGVPGIPRWGARSAGPVLAQYRKIEAIPDDPTQWEVKVRGAKALAENLASRRDDALLYRTLTTLRTDVPLEEDLGDLLWLGPDRRDLVTFCRTIGDDGFAERMRHWRGE